MDGPSLAMAQAGLVRGFFARRCARPEDAEDLAQEALCAIIAAAPRFRGESSASTWAYAICRNVWTGWLARREADRRKLAAKGNEFLAGGQALEGAAACGEGPALELLVGLDLARALSSLSAQEERLYRLYYVEGLGLRSIASTLGKPEGTVKYLLFRLRGRLRSLLS